MAANRDRPGRGNRRAVSRLDPAGSAEVTGWTAGTAGSTGSRGSGPPGRTASVAGSAPGGVPAEARLDRRRTAGSTRTARVTLHPWRALRCGVGSARPQADARCAERAADRRPRDELIEFHYQAFPPR